MDSSKFLAAPFMVNNMQSLPFRFLTKNVKSNSLLFLLVRNLDGKSNNHKELSKVSWAHLFLLKF